MSQKSEEALVAHIKQQLDDSCDSLDYATQLKLKQAREKALSQSAASTSRLKRWQWIGIPSLAATAAVAIITISSVINTPSSGESPESLFFQDLELLAAEEDLELIEELEFYQWLESDASEALES